MENNTNNNNINNTNMENTMENVNNENTTLTTEEKLDWYRSAYETKAQLLSDLDKSYMELTMAHAAEMELSNNQAIRIDNDNKLMDSKNMLITEMRSDNNQLRSNAHELFYMLKTNESFDFDEVMDLYTWFVDEGNMRPLTKTIEFKKVYTVTVYGTAQVSLEFEGDADSIDANIDDDNFSGEFFDNCIDCDVNVEVESDDYETEWEEK